MSTIRVVNIQHSDATEPNIVLEADGTTVFASGITISGGTNLTVSGTAEFASGTVSAPSITFIDDNNTGIYEPAADTVAITTAATERLRVDSSGRVGIGTTSPGDWNNSANQLVISNADDCGITIDSTSSTGSNIHFGDGTTGNESYRGIIRYDNSDDSMRFSTAATEAFRVDSSQRLLVGTSSFTGEASAVLEGSSAGETTQAQLWLNRGQTNPATDNVLGQIIFGDATASGRNGAMIQARADSSWASGDYPTRLVFSTTADGDPSPTERMRIDSSGNIKIAFPDGNNGLRNKIAFTTESPYQDETAYIAADRTATSFAPTDLIFATGTSAGVSERMRIDSSGDVEVMQGKNLTWVFAGGSTHRARIRAESTDALIFENGSGNTERMRIDGSGRLLVGTSSARSNLGGGSESFRMQLEGNGFDTSGFSLVRTSNNNGTPSITFGKTRGTGNNNVLNNDIIGTLFFEGNDGTNFIRGASIAAEVDGTPGTDDMPGRLVFSTTADGANSPTERMRIVNSGQILFNTTNASAIHAARSIVITTVQNGDIAINHNTQNGTGDPFARFGYNGAMIGTITQNGNAAVAYNTSSDYRLKENVVPLTGAIDRVNQLQVHRFNFIADPDRIVDGFIAHEAQAVVPECVTGTKDEVDDDDNPIYQGIDQSKLVPLLTAALQEALAEIESLKARVTALEP